MCVCVCTYLDGVCVCVCVCVHVQEASAWQSPTSAHDREEWQLVVVVALVGEREKAVTTATLCCFFVVDKLVRVVLFSRVTGLAK